MINFVNISNIQTSSIDFSSKKIQGSWNGYKIAQVIGLGITSAIVAIATLVAAIFSSYLLMILCGTALLTLTCSTLLSFRIKPLQTGETSNKANQILTPQKYPTTPFMTLVQKNEDQSPQGPSTAAVLAEIEELNNEIALQQGKNTNIPLSFSLQTTEQVYELLLTTCQQRDQLQYEVDKIK